ncbi:MAG: ABC transporter permease [Actinomycetaceae bacterium]|nr:ABC transporter permease [Actinomycetaceae bacterium]
MNDIVEIPSSGIILAAVILIIIAAAVQWLTKRNGVRILWAGIRMTAQLVAVGFVLDFLFSGTSAWWTLLILIIMEGFAVLTIFGQHKGSLTRKLKLLIGGSLMLGTLLSMMIFVMGIMQVENWWDPRYVIPIFGMIAGNSMTGINLAIRNLTQGVEDRRPTIEQALLFGATPRIAIRPVVREALTAAVTPTTTAMLSMGIVFLPGMMTGQVLSGTPPLIAVTYQALIMIGIFTSVAITVITVLGLITRTVFDTRARLIMPEL